MEVNKLRSENSGYLRSIGIIVMAAAAIIILSTVRFYQPKPPIEIEGVLDPLTIKVNERSTLTLTVKNLNLETHEIKVIFDTSRHISIFEGNQHLLEHNTYTFILEAADPSEQRVFTLSGTLEVGTLSSQYLIAFNVYVGGDKLQKNWDDPILTIQKP